jgi:hypothetical protein
VVDQPRAADYAIWLVALLLYACDAAKLLAPRELLLVEAGAGRLGAVFSENPFTLAGRVLAFGPLLRPWRGVFVAAWGRPWLDGGRVTAAVESLAGLGRSLLVARIIAVWAFALLFVIGPALTLTLGPDAAVLYTAAALYPTVVATIAVLWWRRRAFGLAAGRCARLSLEVLLCPAFLPNLVRKLTASLPIEADAAQMLAAAGAPDVTETVLARLERRAEELIEEAATDEPAGAELRVYLATLRSVPRAPCPS